MNEVIDAPAAVPALDETGADVQQPAKMTAAQYAAEQRSPEPEAGYEVDAAGTLGG